MGVEGTQSHINLPPGFRFYPTDEELVVHYLCKKAASQPFAVPVIAEVELYKFNPWDLPEKALFGEKEWYFFSPRDRKYPNGSRPNRAAASGYWKATGTDKSITSGGGGKVGVKKTLVFYEGRPTKGVKTNWIMHEFCLADSASRATKRKGSLRMDDWVLCRVHKKVRSAQKDALAKKRSAESSSQEDALASSPEIDDSEASINLSRINKLNRISTLKPAMQNYHKPFHDVAQVNGTADNSSGASGGARQAINTDQSAWKKSVGRCPNLAKNGPKEQRCNGETDANPAVVAEAGSAGMRPTGNRGQNHLYLGSRAPALLQMDCSLWEEPWMSTETTTEEIHQISNSPPQRLPSVQMLFGLDVSDSLFPHVESIPPLADDPTHFLLPYDQTTCKFK